MATRPASMPLHIIEGSGFSPIAYSVSMVAIAPAMLASIVLTTTMLIRRSVPESVEPGLNPNQPKARMKVPTTTIGTWWPGMACGLPSRYLPIRGPMTIAPARPMTPPIAWTTPEPAKSTAPWPKLPVRARLGQPAAAPDPVGEQAVGQGHPEPVEAEVLPAPAFGHGPGGDRGRGVHEDHHEEEQGHDADVIHAVQEETLQCPISPYVNAPVAAPAASSSRRCPSLRSAPTSPGRARNTSREPPGR